MIPAKKRFGQHILAPAWADKVVAAIAPRRTDRFIEIGPGPGALTLRLAPRVAHLTAIEIDRHLAEELQDRLPPSAEIVVGDILDIDLAPYLAAGPLRVAGNLPYNISSPILFKLLRLAEPNLVDATVMLQLEVAERLAARPGTKDYGVLTIFASAQADVSRLLTLPPGAQGPFRGREADVQALGRACPPLPGVRAHGTDDVHAAAEDAVERAAPVRGIGRPGGPDIARVGGYRSRPAAGDARLTGAGPTGLCLPCAPGPKPRAPRPLSPKL
jgi:hypothetical protein